MVGDELCPVLTSSTTSLTCQISSSSHLVSNIDYKVEVLVKNFGYALQDSSFLISFLPVIISFSSTQGSTVGGTKITITGLGFSSSSYVQFGSIPYYFFYNNDANNTVISFNSIVVYTASLQNFGLTHGTYEIKVYSNGLKVACSAANACKYVFSPVITPNIDSISPKTVNTSSLMTLTGSNFVSNISLINVFIGKQKCAAVTATSTQITCQLDGLELGYQNVFLNINGNLCMFHLSRFIIILVNSIKLIRKKNQVKGKKIPKFLIN